MIFVKVVVWAVAACAGLWGAAAMLLANGSPGRAHAIRVLGAAVWAGFALWAALAAPYPARVLVPLIGGAAIVLLWRRVPARADRDWATDQARSPVIRFAGDEVHIANFRSFRREEDGTTEERWTDQSFDLTGLVGCDYVVVPFQANAKLAHTMVSFRFATGPNLAISVEARRQVGERYSILRALFRQFELIYVIGDEEDILGERLERRGDTLFIYPIVAEAAGVAGFLLHLLGEAERLNESPAWYDTLRSNCTTSLVKSLEGSSGHQVGWDMRLLLPGGSAALIYDMGLLGGSLPFQELRERSQVDPQSGTQAGDVPFSTWIRRGQM